MKEMTVGRGLFNKCLKCTVDGISLSEGKNGFLLHTIYRKQIPEGLKLSM